jgi:hypothetical protein
MRRRRMVLAATGALLLASGGTALGATLAAGPVDSSGVIHGCWTTTAINGGSHTFVLRDSGTTCPSGTTAISWNTTGPRGPQGVAGPRGPAGPSTAGLAGLDVKLSIFRSGSSARAMCPADHPYALGGGVDTQGPGPMVKSEPTWGANGAPNGWYAEEGPKDAVTVYAICAK